MKCSDMNEYVAQGPERPHSEEGICLACYWLCSIPGIPLGPLACRSTFWAQIQEHFWMWPQTKQANILHKAKVHHPLWNLQLPAAFLLVLKKITNLLENSKPSLLHSLPRSPFLYLFICFSTMPQSKLWSCTSKASLYTELYSLVLMSINRAILGEKKERCMVFSPHSRSSSYKVMNGAPWNQVGFILIGHKITPSHPVGSRGDVRQGNWLSLHRSCEFSVYS